MKEQLAMLIQQVPYGRVISYGALAEKLNILTDATTSGRMVGRILSSMWTKERKYDATFPRWRVINKQGVVSTLKLWEKGITQVDLLRDEWVDVIDGKVDMGRYEWGFGIGGLPVTHGSLFG